MERELFHDFQFQVRYHHLTGRVTLRVTIDGQALPRLPATSRAIINGGSSATRRTRKGPSGASRRGDRAIFSLAVSAPGGGSTARENAPDQGKRS